MNKTFLTMGLILAAGFLTPAFAGAMCAERREPGSPGQRPVAAAVTPAGWCRPGVVRLVPQSCGRAG